jgi:hypothetical protein
MRRWTPKWLLTYNDHPRTWELYKDFNISDAASVIRLNTDKMAIANRRPFRQLIIRYY